MANYFTSDFIVKNSTINPSIIEVRLIISHHTLKSISLLINLDINIKKNTVGITLSLIQAEKNYKIDTLDQRILLCKFFSKSYSKNFNKFGISLFSGNFKIIRPLLLFS